MTDGKSAIEVRLLGQDDVHLLENVPDGVFDDPIDPARAREFLADPRHHLAVALDGGTVVGFVSAVDYLHPDKERPELWINEVSVAASHRRQGIARRLLEDVLAAARRLGCSEAWVLTERSNHAAIKLYSAAGGTEAPEDQVMFTFPLR